MIPKDAEFDVFWEHIYRYRFACSYVQGKEVLDIACGEGYGSAAMLEAGASRVIGVDISEEACKHAATKYGLETHVGNALQIPLPAESLDAVVSFETIEHVSEPGVFLDECLRVLRPGGKVIISTPNRDVYRILSPSNPYHCSELSEAEFFKLCCDRFVNLRLFSQRPLSAPWWSLRGLAATNWATSEIRGLGRINRIWRRLACGHFAPKKTQNFRENPIDAIRMKTAFSSRFVDPYAIRPRKSPQSEVPIYLIAVAEKA